MKCSEKERDTCNVEKMGCEGCYYEKDKIEIGDYVRTKSGFIGKVIARHGGYGLHYELDVKKEIQHNFMNGITHKDNIAKHSKNIIDLIEKDDWINGQHVQEVKAKNKYVMVGNGIDGFQVWEENIRSIVTKEQFKNIEYKV